MELPLNLSFPIHYYLNFNICVLGAGCTHKASFFFRSRIRTTHGVLVQFSYFELESATDKFSNSNLIGVGGSSHVYRGHLKNGKIAAIKRLKTQGGLDEDSVFQTEVVKRTIIFPICSEITNK